MMAASKVSANEIALTFADHDLTISGEFIAFENEAYILTTDVGKMIVPAVLVTCEGSECPQIQRTAVNDS